MAQTKSALALGGIHHCLFSQGLSSFFSRPTYRFIRYTLNHLKLDQLVGVKLHGPLGVAFGWFGASQGDQPGFTVTIEFSRHGRMLALFALQSGFQVSQDKRFTSPLDGQAAHVEGIANLLIRPSSTLWTLVSF